MSAFIDPVLSQFFGLKIAKASLYSFRFVFILERIPMGSLCGVLCVIRRSRFQRDKNIPAFDHNTAPFIRFGSFFFGTNPHGQPIRGAGRLT
jgi:hypothetical protein